MRRRPRLLLVLVLTTGLLLVACGASSEPGGARTDDGGEGPPLVIGGIPDQDRQVLEERFGGLADHLSDELGLPVTYQPSTSYAAVVTAFRNDDVLLGWFGGLTGVQARLGVEGAEAVAQRPRDTEFRSVFIVGQGVEADRLEDLTGLSFTFGSESSTSGHLMPRFFLREAGVDPEEDFDGRPGFSGSHDKTWKLVEAGSFQAGALNEAVWESALDEGAVDTSKVRVLETTSTYFDYHWVVHPAVDERYGEGTAEQLTRALLEMRPDDGPRVEEVLELFQTDRFVATDNSNYERIAEVARDLGMLGEQ